MNLTGTLRITDGESYTFSVKAFKEWKREFQRQYLRMFGSSIKEDVPDSHIRESLYRSALNMKGVDIFGSGRNCISIDQNMFDRAQRVQEIIQNSKN